MSLETCEVWVIVDGQLLTHECIRPIALDPYPGFEDPVEHAIPDVLPDPETGDLVDTVCGTEGTRFLRLFTAAKQLQLSDETKARNVIRVWNNRRDVCDTGRCSR